MNKKVANRSQDDQHMEDHENQQRKSLSHVEVHKSAPPDVSDAKLDYLIELLERVPVELQTADPLTTPNYQNRLSEALRSAETELRREKRV